MGFKGFRKKGFKGFQKGSLNPNWTGRRFGKGGAGGDAREGDVREGDGGSGGGVFAPAEEDRLGLGLGFIGASK